MRILLCLLFLLLPTLPARADDFARSDLNPFLRVHASRSFVDLSHHRRFDDQDYFITRGGGFLAVLSSRVENNNFSNTLARGVGDAGHLATLKQVVSENRIGVLTSCEIDSPDITGLYEITWYGKAGRRNLFTAVLGPSGATGLPACPPGVAEIIQALGDYSLHVANRSGTEILNAP